MADNDNDNDNEEFFNLVGGNAQSETTQCTRPRCAYKHDPRSTLRCTVCGIPIKVCACGMVKNEDGGVAGCWFAIWKCDAAGFMTLESE